MEDIQGEYDILTILNVTSDVCIEKENMSIKMFLLPNKAFKQHFNYKDRIISNEFKGLWLIFILTTY